MQIPRFSGTFQMQTSGLEKNQIFKTEYLDQVEQAFDAYKPIIDQLPSDVVITYRPLYKDFPDGHVISLEDIQIQMQESYLHPARKFSTDGDTRLWPENYESSRPPNTFTLPLYQDPKEIKVELDKFKQWLPKAMLKTLSTIQAIHQRRLEEVQAQAKDITRAINGAIEKLSTP